MKPRIELLIIDPQNDFCDLPPDGCAVSGGRSEQPALPVPGAHADMLRLAAFIDAAAPLIDAISVTLDSHHRLDIAHPLFWQHADGGAVSPFTSISAAQVRDGRFEPRDAGARARTLDYLDALEAQGRYALMVWPVHCEIGSWGHAVHAAVRTAYDRWEDAGHGHVAHWLKGLNPWTEHYSALQAEVPDPDDGATQLNQALLASLDRADWLLVAGEAGSHCVRATVEHLARHLPSGRPSRLLLLDDCMSPVTGFEAEQRAFFDEMATLGVVRLTSHAALQRCRDAAGH